MKRAAFREPFCKSMYISEADYQRLWHLLACSGADLRLYPVRMPSVQGPSQLSDFALVWRFVVLALCRYAPIVFDRLEPHASTLRSSLCRGSVPSAGTMMSFVQQFAGRRQGEELRVLLALFYGRVNHYLCNSAWPSAASTPHDLHLLRTLLRTCYPVSHVLKDAAEVRKRNNGAGESR